MPITVTRIESRVYRAEWDAIVTIEEVITKMKELSVMANEHGEQRYVLLVDLTTVARIPFDIHNLRKVADSDNRVACFVIVKAPPVGQLLGRMLDKVSSMSFSFANDLDEGIHQAHLYLQEHGDQLGVPSGK